MADKLVGAAEEQALANIKAVLARHREEHRSRYDRHEAATRRTGGAHRYGPGGGGYGAGPHLGDDGYAHDPYSGEPEGHAGPQLDGYGRASYGGNGWGQGDF